MLKISFHKRASKDILRLDKEIAKRMLEKIEWIAEHHSAIKHEQLQNLPEDLKGLCKYRIGDYRILYFLNLKEKELQIFGVIHRSKDYKIIRKG